MTVCCTDDITENFVAITTSPFAALISVYQPDGTTPYGFVGRDIEIRLAESITFPALHVSTSDNAEVIIQNSLSFVWGLDGSVMATLDERTYYCDVYDATESEPAFMFRFLFPVVEGSTPP